MAYLRAFRSVAKTFRTVARCHKWKRHASRQECRAIVSPSLVRPSPRNAAAPKGGRRQVLIGEYGSPESRQAYAHIITEQRVAPVEVSPRHDFSVAEVIARFLHHIAAQQADGMKSKEARNYGYALKPVRELYSHAPAAVFKAKALKAVQLRMVDSGLSRGVINRRVKMIRRAFKWAVAEELIPPAVLESLRAVDPLRAGKTTAPQRPPVQPVAACHVAAVLPHVSRQVAAMLKLQQLSGCRPPEVVLLRPCDVDRTGEVRKFIPHSHKGTSRGKARTIYFGPQAQTVLTPFLTAAVDPSLYLFSPAEAEAERLAALRDKRVCPIFPSSSRRRMPKPSKKPGPRYTNESYGKSVSAGIGRVNCHRACLSGGGSFDPVPHFHTHQIRHSHATDVRKQFGLEGAQVALGHSSANVTEIYAERDNDLAIRVAADMG